MRLPFAPNSAASLDEKERGYGEDLVALAAGALVRGAAAAAGPGDAGQLMGPLLQVGEGWGVGWLVDAVVHVHLQGPLV